MRESDSPAARRPGGPNAHYIGKKAGGDSIKAGKPGPRLYAAPAARESLDAWRAA